MKYHIHNGKEAEGPYSIDELKEKGLTKNSMIWHEGLDDWTKAGSLFEFKNEPPPFKATPPPIKKTEKEKTEPLKFPRIIKWTIGGILGIITLRFVLILISGSLETPDYYNNSQTKIENAVNNTLEKREEKKEKKKYQDNISSYLNPHTNDYKRDPIFGNVWDIQIKIDNKTPYTMDKVLVKVNYLKADKNTIKTELITFYNLKPGVRQILEASGCKGAYEAVCYVERVESNELY